MVRYGMPMQDYALPFLKKGLLRLWALADRFYTVLVVTLGSATLACLAGLIAAFVWLVMPFSPVGKPLEVATVHTSGGTEVSILQVFTGTGEPYEVSLFVRRSGERTWTRYYLDHEALFWRARLELRDRESKVVIIRGGQEVACLDLGTGLLDTRDRGIYEPMGILDKEPRTTWPWCEVPDPKTDCGDSSVSSASGFSSTQKNEIFGYERNGSTNDQGWHNGA